MSTLNAFPDWLTEYGPQRPLAELIERVNQIFHDCESRDYDRRHSEMNGEWSHLWREMLDAAGIGQSVRPWRILDFGCGTGFASSQLLKRLPAANIASLTCYDLSPAMLALCRVKIGAIYPAAQFCHDFEALHSFGPFNLLATNALLHHLPDPGRTLCELTRHLAPDALWLSGKEPSARFFKNTDCVRHLEQYLRDRKRFGRASLRYVSPSYWRRKIMDLFRTSPKKQTARLAVAEGLFLRTPTGRVVDRLVDYHVPHSTCEAEAGRGLDIDALKAAFASDWIAAWTKSFAYMGNEIEGELPPRWQRACADLALKYPNDGAFFAVVWKRCAASELAA